VAEKVAQTVSDHALIKGGETVVVGVSGGPDSVSLLHILGRLGADLSLVVAHVDHGLSPTSEEVSADVARRAAEAGLDVHVARAKGLEGPNLHERARDFRLAFFETIRVQEGAQLIATGHTLDDRVETTLARFIHGAGTASLVGIKPRSGVKIRPLIDLRRAETRTYCEEVRLAFVDDLGNTDPRFERTVVRRDLIGSIEKRWGDGAIRAMATSIDRLREDDEALALQAATLAPGMVASPDPGVRRIDLPMLLKLPDALRRRLLEAAVGHVKDRSGGIDAVLDALRRTDRKPDARFAVAQGMEITIGSDHVIINEGNTGSEEANKVGP
jgi:tRNA(Ile)-lysidine synthase